VASVEVNVVWDSAAVRALAQDADVRALMDRLTAFSVQDMKRLCPVSPVGPLHRSGQLRSSITSERQPDGSVHVGPTASYGPYVNDGTPPHLIESHGNYPLRNRETGQVFGRVVHHPGTRATRFIERTAGDINGLVFR
jgi:hypothetical protein